MVSGINNVGFQGGRQVMQPAVMVNPYYQAQGIPADQVELSGKAEKKSAKKGILGTIAAVAVGAAALYAGVKTGKLKHIDNPTKWTQKLGNLAHKGGTYVAKGVDWAKNTSIGTKVVEWGKTAINWVKNLFTKKAAA